MAVSDRRTSCVRSFSFQARGARSNAPTPWLGSRFSVQLYVRSSSAHRPFDHTIPAGSTTHAIRFAVPREKTEQASVSLIQGGTPTIFQLFSCFVLKWLHGLITTSLQPCYKKIFTRGGSRSQYQNWSQTSDTNSISSIIHTHCALERTKVHRLCESVR